jgi:hypothetical protein
MFILKTIKPSGNGANILSSQLYFSFCRVERWTLVILSTHCCQIVSSMIAKSHDTNYKILVAKRNDQNIRWLSD